jgi:hypothetical protein
VSLPFWALQIFSIVFGVLNAVMVYVNIVSENYILAALSGAVAAFLAFNFVRSQRIYLRMKREGQRLAAFLAHMSANSSRNRTRHLRVMELDYCYGTGMCPDCTDSMLDIQGPIVTCRNPQCRSRFTVVNGKWNRVDHPAGNSIAS